MKNIVATFKGKTKEEFNREREKAFADIQSKAIKPYWLREIRGFDCINYTEHGRFDACVIKPIQKFQADGIKQISLTYMSNEV